MPTKPPGLRPAAPRKAWQATKPSPRLRGRAGMKDRQQVKNEEPMCRMCMARGVVEASAVVDHIKPLSEGGTDDRANKQGLCRPCHDAKSKAEREHAAKKRREPR